MRYRRSLLAGILAIGLVATTTSPAFGATYSTFAVPGALDTQPTGMNDREQIVGTYMDGATFQIKGFLLDGGTVTTIAIPGAYSTLVFGINNSGQIVGTSYDTGLGFLLEQGTFTTIAVPGALQTWPLGINDRGKIVGYFYNAVAQHAHGFLLDHGRYTRINAAGAAHTVLSGINNRGDMIGYTSVSGVGVGFLCTNRFACETPGVNEE